MNLSSLIKDAYFATDRDHYIKSLLVKKQRNTEYGVPRSKISTTQLLYVRLREHHRKGEERF